ncbi:MAG: hypothetical protein ACM3XM_11535 [Mycobacterium leprae]
MGHNKPGRGDDFLEGRIADEHMEHAQHLHGAPGHEQYLPITLICQNAQILPTCPGHVCSPTVGLEVGCCWIIIATTGCTTTRPNGATCCWRFLATTDCTDTRGGAACCWQILATTDCTNTRCNDEE